MAEVSPDAPPPAPDPATLRWLWKWLWMWAGRLALTGLIVWLVCLIALLVLFRWPGEANPFTAFLLYLPPSLWCLPGLALIPLALILRFRLALVLSAATVLILGLGSGWRFGGPFEPPPPSERTPDSLMVLTNNRGQGGGHSLRPFMNRVQPDVMLFQESSGRAASYLRDQGYAAFAHGQSLGEFTILSRFPITAANLVEVPVDDRAVKYACRFEMDWDGRRVAIYNVHFPSPRGALLSMRGGAFLYGLPIPTERWRKRRQQVVTFWERHLALAEDLVRRLKAEPLPFVVGGDFNSPHFGRVHHRLRQVTTDAHHAAGDGFGFTFPGQTRNPLSLGGPWMRIDGVFVSPTWQVKGCWTEPDRPSQHRAVAAFLTLEE